MRKEHVRLAIILDEGLDGLIATNTTRSRVGVEAVSYTQLDVYKRQLTKLCWISSVPKTFTVIWTSNFAARRKA